MSPGLRLRISHRGASTALSVQTSMRTRRLTLQGAAMLPDLFTASSIGCTHVLVGEETWPLSQRPSIPSKVIVRGRAATPRRASIAKAGNPVCRICSLAMTALVPFAQ